MTYIREKILTKKMLYVFCFVLLNCSDMLRDLQFESFQFQQGYIRLADILPGYKMGDVWLVLGNFTGIIMMIIVFSGWDKKKLCTKISVVCTMICLAAMIVLPFVRTGKYGTILIQEELAIINVWWITIVLFNLLCEISKEKKPKSRLTFVLGIWIAITLCMFFSITNENIWPVFYLGMFGAFFLTPYKKEDINQLYSALIDGSIGAFFIMQMIAFLFRPYDTVRYQMLYSNCNSAAQYYLIIYIMCLGKLHILEMKKAKKSKKIIYLLVAGAVLTLQLMTCCRIVWAASVIVTVVYGIVIAKRLWQKTWKQVLSRGGLIVGSMLITFLPVFMMVRWIPTIIPARLWYSGEYDEIETKIMVYDSADSEKYVELDELLETALGRIVYMFVEPEKPIENVETTQLLTESSDNEVNVADASLRDRIEISKMYLKEVTWWGNNPDGDEIARMRTHAHNLYIQVAYFYGIPSVVLLIILAVALLVRLVKKMRGNPQNPYIIIALLITIGFFFTGMTNVVWARGQLFLFMVFFMQYPYKDEVNYIEAID